jgi:hypothetical protein
MVLIVIIISDLNLLFFIIILFFIEVLFIFNLAHSV